MLSDYPTIPISSGLPSFWLKIPNPDQQAIGTAGKNPDFDICQEPMSRSL